MDPISFKILWSRLVGVVEEACATLRRCAFSALVTESNDCTAVLFDARGEELAEPYSLTGTTFIGTIPRTVQLLLERFPPNTWRPGDVLITNDPWLGTGHLFDTSMIVPIFRKKRLVAFAATVAHAPDIGGSGGSIRSREVFEEGLRIPPTWLYRSGERQSAIFDIIEANVRLPRQTVGDLDAQLAAATTMSDRVVEIMDENNLDSWAQFSSRLAQMCHSAMCAAVKNKLPAGRYRYVMQTDGLERPIELRCEVHVPGDGSILVDYSGSSRQVDRAINCPIPFTLARTRYALKAVLLPTIPNNSATFASIHVKADPGLIVNAVFPAATAGRSVIGHFLPSVIMGALAEAVPNLVVAEGAGPAWAVNVSGFRTGGERFSVLIVLGTGQGASSGNPGLDVITYPGNASNIPVEVLESETGLRVIRKEIRRDSGGNGKWRGGWGQRFAFEVVEAPIQMYFWADRTKTPARGLLGGETGKVGSVRINGEAVDVKRQQIGRVGDIVEIATPGGGGFGPSDTISRVSQDH